MTEKINMKEAPKASKKLNSSSTPKQLPSPCSEGSNSMQKQKYPPLKLSLSTRTVGGESSTNALVGQQPSSKGVFPPMTPSTSQISSSVSPGSQCATTVSLSVPSSSELSDKGNSCISQTNKTSESKLDELQPPCNGDRPDSCSSSHISSTASPGTAPPQGIFKSPISAGSSKHLTSSNQGISPSSSVNKPPTPLQSSGGFSQPRVPRKPLTANQLRMSPTTSMLQRSHVPPQSSGSLHSNGELQQRGLLPHSRMSPQQNISTQSGTPQQSRMQIQRRMQTQKGREVQPSEAAGQFAEIYELLQKSEKIPCRVGIEEMNKEGPLETALATVQMRTFNFPDLLNRSHRQLKMKFEELEGAQNRIRSCTSQDQLTQEMVKIRDNLSKEVYSALEECEKIAKQWDIQRKLFRAQQLGSQLKKGNATKSLENLVKSYQQFKSLRKSEKRKYCLRHRDIVNLRASVSKNLKEVGEILGADLSDENKKKIRSIPNIMLDIHKLKDALNNLVNSEKACVIDGIHQLYFCLEEKLNSSSEEIQRFLTSIEKYKSIVAKMKKVTEEKPDIEKCLTVQKENKLLKSQLRSRVKDLLMLGENHASEAVVRNDIKTLIDKIDVKEPIEQQALDRVRMVAEYLPELIVGRPGLGVTTQSAAREPLQQQALDQVRNADEYFPEVIVGQPALDTSRSCSRSIRFEDSSNERSKSPRKRPAWRYPRHISSRWRSPRSSKPSRRRRFSRSPTPPRKRRYPRTPPRRHRGQTLCRFLPDDRYSRSFKSRSTNWNSDRERHVLDARGTKERGHYSREEAERALGMSPRKMMKTDEILSDNDEGVLVMAFDECMKSVEKEKLHQQLNVSSSSCYSIMGDAVKNGSCMGNILEDDLFFSDLSVTPDNNASPDIIELSDSDS